MNGYDMFLPGKRLHFAKKNMAIEIVDIPTKNGDIPWLCKRLPEGKSLNNPIYVPLNPINIQHDSQYAPAPWRRARSSTLRAPTSQREAVSGCMA